VLSFLQISKSSMPLRFATTSWTQVLAARDAPSSESHQALEGFRQAYWHPVYAFVLWSL